ncbi:hypothetical protein N0V95_002540 [Ascochyta clinopodiicola]|nr:hypothetical protein N0V95_002540 [Ascochyta clinopodiicola]
MSISIDTSFIRSLHPDRTRIELEALRGGNSDERITEILLDAIERGSLSTATFAAWLSVCRSSPVIEKSLRQKTSELRKQVEYANVIMMDLLEIAFSALHEPSFQSSSWHETVQILTHVIKVRIRLSMDMEKSMNVPHQEIYYALWEDTITTLIRAETLANQEENEKLGANTISGIIVGKTAFADIGLDNNSRATWKFLDNLARARNDLWKDLRPAMYPDVLTLPEPFPRGLPVQHLLACWTPNTADLCELAPYVFSRVESTLFVSSEGALNPVSSDENTQHAIGAFVDSYQYALNAYIPDICDRQEKEQRLAKAWDYATGPLSKREMSSEEAIRYWKQHVPSYLQSTLSKIMPVKEHVPWPAAPDFDDSSEAHEWNPLEGRPANVKVKARDLGTATYIDLCTIGNHAKLTKPHIQSHYELPAPQIPAEEISVASIWGCHTTDTEQEAGALAALLFLDAKYGSDGRMLTTPFPSHDDVRYPCLYLDEDFLSRDELRVPDAAVYLSRHIGLVPLLLVHDLATILVAKLGCKKNSRVMDETAFALIRALSESDKPGLAFDLAVEVITGKSSASSWHRMLFNNGFLQRLPASDARACISKFAEAVGEKLDAQKLRAQQGAAAGQSEQKIDARAQASEGNDPQESHAIIKVTTLKSLAQLLHGSTYIGDESSLEILSSLSRKVSHVDVRSSILRTLLSKLDANRPGLWDGILSTLQSFVPLAASLDEREHMTESDWAHVEKTMTMPMARLIAKPTWREESPMLHAIVQKYLDISGSELKDLYLKLIILPSLELLKQQTKRWASLFLRKYSPDHVESLQTMLPPTPLGIAIWDTILSGPSTKPHHIPKTILNEYLAYMSFRIDPPGAICALNKSLEGNAAVRSRPEVSIWLELYGNGVDNVWLHRFSFTGISKFDDQENGDDQLYITRQFYQKKWLELFTTLLWSDDPNYVQLRFFVSTLTNPFNLPCPWWNRYGRTTIEAMFAHVNGIRTRNWEVDPNRKPAVLPDTFNWKLSLLSYPLTSIYNDNNATREQACKQFADELSAIIDEISHSMYYTKIILIQGRICNGRNLSNKDFKDNLMLSALYLGNISKTRLSWLTTPDLLRVELAAGMVMETKGMDNGALRPSLKTMLESWIANENEEVRRTGYKVQNEYYDADNKKIELTRLRPSVNALAHSVMKSLISFVFYVWALCFAALVGANVPPTDDAMQSFKVSIPLNDTSNDTITTLGYDPSYDYHGWATVEVWTGGSSRKPVNVGELTGSFLHNTVYNILDKACPPMNNPRGNYCSNNNWSGFRTKYLWARPVYVKECTAWIKTDDAQWATQELRDIMTNIVGRTWAAYTEQPIGTKCYQVPGRGNFCNVPRLVRVNMPKTSPGHPGWGNFWHAEIRGCPEQFSKTGNLKPCGTRGAVDAVLDRYSADLQAEFSEWRDHFRRETRVIIDGF